MWLLDSLRCCCGTLVSWVLPIVKLLWATFKLAFCFSCLCWLSFLCSPWLVPLFLFVLFPLTGIALFYLLTDARALIACVLKLYKKWNVLCLRWKGLSEAEDSLQRLASGKVWQEFCDTLSTAAAAISRGPMDAQTQAEGYRFLARVTRAGLANFLEYSDPKVPELHSLVGETIKMGADNPDNLYESCPLEGGHCYRIVAVRGTVKYLALATHLGHYGKQAGLPPIGRIDNDDLILIDCCKQRPPHIVGAKKQLAFEESLDSWFSVILSPKPPTDYGMDEAEMDKVNWLRIAEDCEDITLIVRQTFGRRTVERAAQLHIERWDMDKSTVANGSATMGQQSLTNNNSGFVACTNGLVPSAMVAEYPEKERYRVTDSARKPSEVTPTSVSKALSQASALVVGSAMLFSKWAQEMDSQWYVNRLPLFDQSKSTAMGGDPLITYYHSYFKLPALNDALLITVNIPRVLFWNFQLNNHWMESLDYRYFPVHINSELAKYSFVGDLDDDLSSFQSFTSGGDSEETKDSGCKSEWSEVRQKYVVIVVCHQPYLFKAECLPSVLRDNAQKVNWLSTAGHSFGTMLFRWLCVSGDYEHPQCVQIKLNDVNAIDL